MFHLAIDIIVTPSHLKSTCLLICTKRTSPVELITATVFKMDGEVSSCEFQV